MSGTTWLQCGHSTGSSEWISSCASCSSARCRPSRSSRSATAATVRWMASCSICGMRGDVDESQCGVDGQDRRGEARQRGADIARVLVDLVGRAGEPQRGADEPADGRGGQRDRHPANACLDDQRADGTGAGHHPRGELRRQPGQGRGRGEGERAERADHEAVHATLASAAAAGAPPPRAPTSGPCCRPGCRAPRGLSGPPRSRRPAARRTSARRSHRSAAPTRRRARCPTPW